MNNKEVSFRIKMYKFIKFSMFVYLFVVGYFMESNSLKSANLQMIGGLFAVMMMTEVLREVFSDKDSYKFYSLMISIILVYVIGEYTVVMGNYFFFAFYLLLFVDGLLLLKRPFSEIYAFFVMFLSIVRLVITYVDTQSIEGIGYILFYVIICSLIMTAVNFSKKQKFEKELNRRLYEDLNKLHDEIENLILVKERNRIARDVHDTLGHQWMSTIMQLEMIEKIVEENPIEAVKRIKEVKATARESMKSVRGVVEALEENGKLTITQALIGMILKFERRSGMTIQYKFKGDHEYTKMINDTVFRLVQESMTNASRHGRANNVLVDITFKKKIIVFEIIDDGCGAPKLEKGFGLNGMTQRIEKIGGDIDFDGSDGFKVSGLIKVASEVNYD